MRKIYTLLLFTILSRSISAQCGGFFDGFESGTYAPTWTLGAVTTTFNVNTSSPAPYAGNFQLTGTGSSGHYAGLVHNLNPATPTYVSWSIYLSGNNNTNYFVAGDNSVTTNNGMVFCYRPSTNVIRFVGPSSNYEYTAANNQWYNIELKNINWTAKNFDIYINNTLVQTAFPFRAPTTLNLTKIHLYNFTSGVGTWDNIKVGYSLSANSSSLSCFGDSNGSATVTVNSGAAPFSYSWSPAPSTNSVITGLSAGTYTCYVTDANTCIATTTININQPPAITLTAVSSNSAFCGSGTTTLSANVSGGTGSLTYTWAAGPSNTTHIVTPSVTSVYTVNASDANNCLKSNTVSVMIYSIPTVAVNSGSICTGSSFTISPSGANSYTIQGGNAVVSPTANSTYTVIGESVNNCFSSNTATASIFVNPLPNVGATSSTTLLCSGSIASLTANGANTYSWSNGSTNTVITIAPNTTTNYTVIGYDNNGCANTATIVQNVNACTGISENDISLINTISIFPNPNTGTFKINSQLSHGYHIYNNLGQLVQTGNLVAGENSLELNEQPSGIYLITLQNEKFKATFKIIKQ